MKFSNLVLGLVFGFSPLALAGTQVFTGPSSEKMMIQDASKLGKNVFLIKISGIETKWADKVIKTIKVSAPSGDRYQFDYEIELTGGNKKKTYQIVVDAGFELKNGSRVQKVQLWTTDMPDHNKPYELDYDGPLSKAGGNDLVAEYAKSPYKPEVD